MLALTSFSDLPGLMEDDAWLGIQPGLENPDDFHGKLSTNGIQWGGCRIDKLDCQATILPTQFELFRSTVYIYIYIYTYTYILYIYTHIHIYYIYTHIYIYIFGNDMTNCHWMVTNMILHHVTLTGCGCVIRSMSVSGYH